MGMGSSMICIGWAWANTRSTRVLFIPCPSRSGGRGLIVSAWDSAVTSGPPRRVYQLTPDCEAYLAAWMRDLRATHDVLARLLAVYDETMETIDIQKAVCEGNVDSQPCEFVIIR